MLLSLRLPFPPTWLPLLLPLPLHRLADAGLHFLGAVPEDKLLRAVRLDEVQIAMDADLKFGSKVQLDQVGVCPGENAASAGRRQHACGSSACRCWFWCACGRCLLPVLLHCRCCVVLVYMRNTPATNRAAVHLLLALPCGCRSTRRCMLAARAWSSCWS